jgi:hypothetical protein
MAIPPIDIGLSSGTVELPKKENTQEKQEEGSTATRAPREDFEALLVKYYDAIQDSYKYNGDELQRKKFQSSIDLAYTKLKAFSEKHNQFKKEVPNKYLVKLSSEFSFEDLRGIVAITDPGFEELDRIAEEALKKYGGGTVEDSNSNEEESSGDKENCLTQ